MQLNQNQIKFVETLHSTLRETQGKKFNTTLFITHTLLDLAHPDKKHLFHLPEKPETSQNETLTKHLASAHKIAWENIHPTLFGIAHQLFLQKEDRKNLGAHYTIDSNILKVLNPLFVEPFQTRINAATNIEELEAIQDNLASKIFIDPAAGSGNFLHLTYLYLRKLETHILQKIKNINPQHPTKGKISTRQVSAIEIDPSAAKLIELGLLLTYIQINQTSDPNLMTGETPVYESPDIYIGNALTLDWISTLKQVPDFFLGNPPFLGKTRMTKEHKFEIQRIEPNIQNHSLLDYCAGWYLKSADYIKRKNPTASATYITTNSIYQGEQVEILWGHIFSLGFNFQFAYPSFEWKTNHKSSASVSCAISCITLEQKERTLYEEKKEPLTVEFINAYLLDSPNIFLKRKANPITPRKEIIAGTHFGCGGNLILTPQDKERIIQTHPNLTEYIHPLANSSNLLQGKHIFGLQLTEAPRDILNTPPIKERLDKVEKHRANLLKKVPPHKYYDGTKNPILGFDALCLPRTSSYLRKYYPVLPVKKGAIVDDSLFYISNPDTLTFGILQSSMLTTFLKAFAATLNLDWRFSSSIYYNLPFPHKLPPPHC